MRLEAARTFKLAQPADRAEWISVAAPPPPYTIVLLSFDDGSVRRGVWNGKIWWGYDERVRRARELHPLRWRLWTETHSAGAADEKVHLPRAWSRERH
jgi:hypothetical protein